MTDWLFFFGGLGGIIVLSFYVRGMVMRIIFVRHGEPNYEKDCLTELGHRQAELAAERLKGENITEIWSSPQGRAAETAGYTARALGLPVKTLDFMHEVYWAIGDGPLYKDGHPWETVDEMARKGIDLNRADWRESPYFSNNRVLECVDKIDQGIDDWLKGYGYIREGFYYTHTEEEKEHRTVALFSHGGSSSAAIGHIINLPFPYVCALFHVEHTGITVVRLDRHKGHTTLPCLELENDVMHIK